MPFVYIHIVWFGCWIGFGVEGYPYGLLTMIVSLEAIFLSTFVMISQNRADAKRQAIADQQWQTVQKEDRQNEELLALSQRILELTTAIHAVTTPPTRREVAGASRRARASQARRGRPAAAARSPPRRPLRRGRLPHVPGWVGRRCRKRRRAVEGAGALNVPPVSENLDRAAAWTWRLLVCASALAVLFALVWYVRVIALPIAVALTIAPALSPVASWFRARRHLERASAGLALLTGLAVVALLVSIVAVSVVQQFDELVDSVARAVDDIVAQMESERFNLTLADDLQSTLESSWRQASGYAASGVQAGAGIVTGVALAVAMLYFVLRDGDALWASILRNFPSDTRPAVDRAGRRA